MGGDTLLCALSDVSQSYLREREPWCALSADTTQIWLKLQQGTEPMLVAPCKLVEAICVGYSSPIETIVHWKMLIQGLRVSQQD